MGCCGGGMFGSKRSGRRAQPASGQSDLQAVLQERLARGEISVDEYERIRAILEEAPARTRAVNHPQQMPGG